MKTDTRAGTNRSVPKPTPVSQRGAYSGNGLNADPNASTAPFRGQARGESADAYARAQTAYKLAQLTAQMTAGKHQQSPAAAAAAADKYVIGRYANAPDVNWSQQTHWLMTGSTDTYAQQVMRTVGGQTYIGNDKDGFVPYKAEATNAPGLDPNSPNAHLRFPLGGNDRERQRHPSPDHTQSPTQFVDAFIALSKDNPARFGQIQDLLWKAGYYGSSKPAIGAFSGSDTAAMVSAIQEAIQVKTPIQDFLTKKAMVVQAQGLNNRAPLVISYADPEKIKGALNSNNGGMGTSVAAQTIGRNLDPNELQGYIDKIHAGQAVAQTAAYNAHASSPDPTAGAQAAAAEVYKSTPTDGNTLEQLLKEGNPTEHTSTQLGKASAQIEQMLTQHMPGATAT